MDVIEKIQALIERQKESVAKVEASMSSVPEKYKACQLAVLEQLKSELMIWEEMLAKQKL